MITIDPDGNWQVYSQALPNGVEVLGTITRRGYDTGALVRFKTSGNYAQVNAGIVRSVPAFKVLQSLEDAKAKRLP
jgi:hypothetical protein